MDSPYAIARWLVPQVPSLAYASALHSLGFSPTSSKWDLRTEMTVQVLRLYMTGKGRKPPTVAKAQAMTLKDPGIKGKIWVAKETVRKPASENGSIEDAVINAVEALKPGEIKFSRPGLSDIEVEWTGYRSNAGNQEVLPDVSEEEKYKRMLAEPSRTSDVTILYFHGGVYYLCDPATHRPVTVRLAQESHGRVCSVRYRLAPQTAFPGQLVDALMVYLSLIYPPEGSLHEAIPANHIVFAGDSAGGNLACALLQLLLQLHRTSSSSSPEGPTLRFHGRDVPVPLPAGVSANSGWFDLSRSMPSVRRNIGTDYLPALRDNESVARYVPDAIWPADPPRGDLFVDLSCLDHPLAGLVLADDWRGAPPMWLCTGDEMISDEDSVVAARAARQGVVVQYEHYEAMPHCFALVLPHLETAKRCLRSWGDWARRCVEEPEALRTMGTYVRAKSGQESELEVANVGAVSDEEAKRLVKEKKEWRIKGFDDAEAAKLKPVL